jgi:hypothetical protein
MNPTGNMLFDHEEKICRRACMRSNNRSNRILRCREKHRIASLAGTAAAAP